jgi:hypothetical protein
MSVGGIFLEANQMMEEWKKVSKNNNCNCELKNKMKKMNNWKTNQMRISRSSNIRGK